ncbi:MAG: glycine zipper 2TM domain-containing protein [Betaproteobacteria bacterium]|nr:glycine zipper 2TM domain-containing protein [Betaproteobacteria bacterium]
MNKNIAVILLAMAVVACATEATTKGTAWGAGIGALVGGAAGGHGSDAVIGAAIGAGIGYVIGNEQDKSKAQKMSDETRSSNYAHSETGPLGGTSWRLQDWSPKDAKAEVRGKSVEFGRNGWVKTTTTYNDGRIDTDSESYRVIDNTLIVNKGDYLVNYKFSVQGDQLTVDNSKVRALLKRM